MSEQSATNQYDELQTKFINLTQRERSLAVIAGVCLILLSGYVFFIEPMMLSVDKKQTQIERRQAELDSLDNKINELKVELNKDPNAPIKARLESLRQKIVEADNTLSNLTTDLIPAAQMPLLLENVFAQFATLDLIEMQSIAPTKILQQQTQGDKEQGAKTETIEANLYQHGVKLTLQGSYFDVQRYLERVEALPWKFYWKRFSYQVKEYPKAEVTVEIYTLSTTQAFIGMRNDV